MASPVTVTKLRVLMSICSTTTVFFIWPEPGVEKFELCFLVLCFRPNMSSISILRLLRFDPGPSAVIMDYIASVAVFCLTVKSHA